jgi:hypothetical protein
MGLYDKSVKLAIECQDIDKAKEYANRPQETKMKKKLWMKIAKYLFRAKGSGENVDVENALEILLKDSPLNTDDLLPLFPNDTKVGKLKEHLCKCHDDYHEKVSDLKVQLNHHSQNAEILRKQMREQRNRHITINPS